MTLRKMLFRLSGGLHIRDIGSHCIPIFVIYPLQPDSPLLQSRLRFVDSTSELQIGTVTATLLDDMRFLTTSVIAMTKNELSSAQENARFLATATWIHKRLAMPVDPSLAGDFIYQSVRAISTAYSAAILSRRPLSEACNERNLRHLWMNMWRVPLSRWKQTPGIFFFHRASCHTLCEGQARRTVLEGHGGGNDYCYRTRGLGCCDGDVERVFGSSEMVATWREGFEGAG
ncbi:hypothetical protein D0Z07_1521 [Hyphodiscus hymeniophilus]|uniref:Uncharacterized protein n=1 Tax=Hyphodiscus hymeniophilus TaxID=353542 RepID=A0A9P6VPF5_9HELO|nr:hypothetical protein D0Z07_1521 [Hyphodiscus hymeniophilus]